MQAIKNITAHADYREAVAKLDSYREALTDARQLADKLDCERVAHDVKDFEPNAIELADRLLSGVALQDNLSKRITETARKIEALRRAIELQQREVLRIRGEHSRIVCRAAVNEHAAIVGRILKAVEELDAANRAEIECRAGIERAGYSSTLLPPMAFSPQGLDFNTRDVDGGYAPAWARDVADYIQARALPVEASEKRAIAAALEAAANSRRMPKPAARLSHPGEGEIIG
ncbi:hypothetical protein [Diaphorobacter nitroreducens]|uniref:hypothetical protein n=1 Tax=Diaphorobacter nitroreducens TaxID=164759 RepID=UPI0035B2BEC2